MIQKLVRRLCQSPMPEIVREGDSIGEIQSPSLTTQSRELSLQSAYQFLNHFRYIPVTVQTAKKFQTQRFNFLITEGGHMRNIWSMQAIKRASQKRCP